MNLFSRQFKEEGGKITEIFPSNYGDNILFKREIETGSTYTLIRDIQGTDITSTLYISGSVSPVDVTVDMVKLNQSNANLFKFTEYIETVVVDASVNAQPSGISFNQLIQNNTTEEFSALAWNKGQMGLINSDFGSTINYVTNALPFIDTNPITVTFSAGTETDGVRAVQIRGRLI